MSAGPAAEPRETSGATTALLLAHVRRQGGDGAVEAVLRRAGVPHSAAELSQPSHWTSYDTRIRLFTAATEVLGEPRTMFRVGREALGNGLHPALVLLVRTMGSPRRFYRQLPRAVATFSTTSTMRVLAASGTSATLSYTLHEGYRHSRLDCEYAQGLIGMVPTVFGLPPAGLEHPECESDGHPACVYRLSWQRRGWRRGPRRRPAADPELVALRQQLSTLQSAAAEALDSSREEADRAGALLGLAHELSGATEAATVSAVVAEALPRVVGCHSAAVLLWDPASGCLRASAVAGHTGAAAALLGATPLHAEDVPELVGMLADREPRFLRPQSSSPVLRDLLLGMAVGDVVAVPVLAGGTFLGVVTAGWPAGRARGLVGDSLARLRGVGDQAATALQRARLLETVRHQATHDVLTGLPNRVLFLETLAGALAGAGAGQHVGVLFCDLDRFTAVNDSLGHAAGDELLRQVAARLRAAVRPGDAVGRLSGDEFAVVLPALARPGDAGRVVDRVTGCFAEPFRLGGTRVSVGVSVGVAVHGGPGGDPGALLRTADAEMHRHKKRTPFPPRLASSPRDPGGGHTSQP